MSLVARLGHNTEIWPVSDQNHSFIGFPMIVIPYVTNTDVANCSVSFESAVWEPEPEPGAWCQHSCSDQASVIFFVSRYGIDTQYRHSFSFILDEYLITLPTLLGNLSFHRNYKMSKDTDIHFYHQYSNLKFILEDQT